MECVMHGRGNLGGDDSVPLRIYHQNTRRRIESTQLFCNAHLLGTLCESILSFHIGLVAGRCFQPPHVIVDSMAWQSCWRKRLKKLFRQPLSPLYACVNVVTLLKVDVFKKIPTDD